LKLYNKNGSRIAFLFNLLTLMKFEDTVLGKKSPFSYVLLRFAFVLPEVADFNDLCI